MIYESYISVRAIKSVEIEIKSLSFIFLRYKVARLLAEEPQQR